MGKAQKQPKVGTKNTCTTLSFAIDVLIVRKRSIEVILATLAAIHARPANVKSVS